MTTPSKRAARQIPRQEDDEEAAPPQAVESDNGDDTDDDEEAPTQQIRRGMSAGRQVMDSTSSFAQAFKFTDQIQIIKFLEDEPYANYTRHWIERQTPTGRSPRSYNCLRNWGKHCPLCEEAGDRPQAVSAFNVALIGDDGVALLKTLDAGRSCSP